VSKDLSRVSLSSRSGISSFFDSNKLDNLISYTIAGGSRSGTSSVAIRADKGFNRLASKASLKAGPIIREGLSAEFFLPARYRIIKLKVDKAIH
jgi:hypothetical protein